jgi:hypothetical protein
VQLVWQGDCSGSLVITGMLNLYLGTFNAAALSSLGAPGSGTPQAYSLLTDV